MACPQRQSSVARSARQCQYNTVVTNFHNLSKLAAVTIFACLFSLTLPHCILKLESLGVHDDATEADASESLGELHVTKKEIVKEISDQIGLTQLKTKEIVQKTFDAIVDTLVETGRIELRNFGVFEVKQR